MEFGSSRKNSSQSAKQSRRNIFNYDHDDSDCDTTSDEDGMNSYSASHNSYVDLQMQGAGTAMFGGASQ